MLPLSFAVLNIVSWIIVGLFAAVLVNKLDRSKAEDLLPAFVSALIGAFLGGTLSAAFFGPELSFSTLTISLSMALFLSVIGRILRKVSEDDVRLKPRKYRAS